MALNLTISEAVIKKLDEKHQVSRSEVENGTYAIKTAYEPNKDEVAIYEKYA